jgi:hypothetical protein
VRVVGDTNAFAIFEPRPGLGVTKSGTGTGTVTSSPAGINCGISCWAPFPQFSQVTLTATPAADSSVTVWSGPCAGSGTTCVTQAVELANIDVTFTIKPLITVTKDGTGSGTVTSTPAGIDCGAGCNEHFVFNSNVTLTAAPAVGSDFAGWSGGCGAGLTCSFAADGEQSRTATFTRQRHALNVSLSGTGSGSVSSAPAGINCGADCAEDYLHDTVVTLTAAAVANNTFDGWTGACTGAATTCTVTMSQVQAVTASFRVNQSSGSSSGGGGGAGGGGGGGSFDWMMLTLGAGLLWRRRCRASSNALPAPLAA